ncbi:MAG TPA: hypothetical protein VFX92_01680 [Candidatus Krumholzibacteria bacterium]|nr:hypothetical protein [Candidatus Krumholzibacteria bacterium]
MRTLLLTITCVAALAAFGSPATAQEKNVGLGFILGEPTGIDAKIWLANEHALEFGAAWSLSGNNEFHLQGDYLFHKFDVFDLTTGDQLPLFFGVGGRMILVDNVDDVFGVRFPVGLAYIFAEYPFDIFAEIVPILDVAPDTDFDLEGAIGARFWF